MTTVPLTKKPYLLQENGAKLLLESGGGICLYMEGIELQIEFSSDVWTTVTDVVWDTELAAQWGIQTASPTQRVASGGKLKFTLDNSHMSSGGKQGYYTPGHTDCRTGFKRGIGVRLVITYGKVTRYIGRGRITSIDPDAGRESARRTICKCKDWIGDAAKLKPEGLEVQVNKTADQLLTAALAKITNQPPTTSFGIGKSTFAYSFDEVVIGKTTMLQICRNIALSELGFISPVSDTTGGGTLKFWNRHERVLETTVSIDLNDTGDSDSFSELKLSDDEKDIYNIIKTTVYPRTVSAAADKILWSLAGDDPTLSPGATLLIIGRYSDPDNPGVKCAGTEMVTPVEGTDYTFSGADSDLSVTAVFGGTSVRLTLENTGTSTGTVTKLQVRGKSILVWRPVLMETSDSDSITLYGDRPLSFRPTYQDNTLEGKDFSDVILSSTKDGRLIAKSVTFTANRSASLMTATLIVNPGTRISITDVQAGFSAQEYFINGVKMSFTPLNLITVTWILALATLEEYFVLDTSKLDGTAVLGF